MIHITILVPFGSSFKSVVGILGFGGTDYDSTHEPPLIDKLIRICRYSQHGVKGSSLTDGIGEDQNVKRAFGCLRFFYAKMF